MATEKAEIKKITPANNEKKTPKQLVLTGPDGTQYTLQFNRKTVLTMQRNGFVLDLDRLYMCARVQNAPCLDEMGRHRGGLGVPGQEAG